MNVHTIHSRRQNNPQDNIGSAMFFSNERGIEGFTADHLKVADEHKVLFLSGRTKVKPPQDENYCDMLILMCCPVFKCFSFTTLMLLIYIAVFTAEACIGLQKNGELLQINSQTLILMGANDPPLVREGQVWRLITAAVLHAHFLHFLGNFVSTIILLSRVEYTIGPLRSFFIYLGAAIGGNIFSALCQPDVIKVGASTCLYGLLGLNIGYIFINWSGLNRIGPIMKCQLICLSLMILIFTIVFTSVSGSSIDYFGHLGGFLSGFWLSSINNTIDKGAWERNLRIIFLFFFIVQLTICFCLFYLLNINFGSL